MDIKCKKTLILQPTQVEALTKGEAYTVTDEDATGIYINNNQGDRHHFSAGHCSEYFE